jgi:hypothetical protein
MPETLIKHRDITGVTLHFTSEQINRMMLAMPDEQRRFAMALAETIRQPHEIWQRWGRDIHDPKQWRQVRCYLQFLDLSDTDVEGGFGVALMQFTHLDDWCLSGSGVVLGDKATVMEKINAEARQGSIEYSVSQQ